jgi:7,8-dihydropterin-6-yl-methyl-4-(beta-D-ribofuranosyl)aminobenzene 5'-phosphate synthase
MLLVTRLLSLSLLAASALAQEMEIRVIYDNTSARDGIQEDWGFSAVATLRVQRVLFDSGTKPGLFLENLKKLEVEPSSLQAALISHEHRDHRSGIYKLFPSVPRLPIYFLDSFESSAWDEASAIAMRPERVREPRRLAPGIHSSGLVAGEPDEQAMVLETRGGIVMLVGCSHPGVVKMVETVKRIHGARAIRLLLGGFHMFRQTAEQIQPQVERLKELGVERIMPAHCTGELAHGLLRKAFGDGYSGAGAGRIVRLD